jgi:hypothetical protein
MILRSLRNALLGAGLSSFLAVAAGAPLAHAQSGSFGPCAPAPGDNGSSWRPAVSSPCDVMPSRPVPVPAPQGQPSSTPLQPLPATGPEAAPAPTTPQQPATGQQPSAEQALTGQQPGAEQAQNQAQEPSAGQEQAAAELGESVAVADPGGYLDPAIPRTMFRLRFDAAFDMNHPDRAEWFWPAWREMALHAHAINKHGVFQGFEFDPTAKGPVQFANRVDFEEIHPYVEVAFTNRLSAFVDVPVRFVHFRDLKEETANEPFPGEQEADGSANNTSGLSDIQAGMKYALIACPTRYVTFQFRTYIPTGDTLKGLGTGHVSLEPGLLVYQRLTDRLVFQGEFEDWSAVDGSLFAGNILTYGVGLGYDVYRSCGLRITPVTEFIGWTVLKGQESFFGPVAVPSNPPAGLVPGAGLPTTHGIRDEVGDTIVNAKVGVRTYFGNHSDLYVGYGQSLTGERWYREIARVEYRLYY